MRFYKVNGLDHTVYESEDELPKDLKIINSIMKAPPTDGLWGDTRTDEDQIGASYNELEWAMTIKEFKNLPIKVNINKELYKEEE